MTQTFHIVFNVNLIDAFGSSRVLLKFNLSFIVTLLPYNTVR